MLEEEYQWLQGTGIITSWIDPNGADRRFVQTLIDKGAHILTTIAALRLDVDKTIKGKRQKILVLLGEHQYDTGLEWIKGVIAHLRKKKLALFLVSFLKKSKVKGAEFVDPYETSPNSFAEHVSDTLRLSDFPMPKMLDGYPAKFQWDIDTGSKKDTTEYADLWMRAKWTDWTADLCCNKEWKLFQRRRQGRTEYMVEIKNENNLIDVGNCDSQRVFEKQPQMRLLDFKS